MLISTLTAYCEALGADLHIVMQYGDTQVRLMTPELITRDVSIQKPASSALMK